MSINNIEALIEEPYSNNIENHRGKVSLEITKSVFLTKEVSGRAAYYKN